MTRRSCSKAALAHQWPPQQDEAQYKLLCIILIPDFKIAQCLLCTARNLDEIKFIQAFG